MPESSQFSSSWSFVDTRPSGLCMAGSSNSHLYQDTTSVRSSLTINLKQLSINSLVWCRVLLHSPGWAPTHSLPVSVLPHSAGILSMCPLAQPFSILFSPLMETINGWYSYLHTDLLLFLLKCPKSSTLPCYSQHWISELWTWLIQHLGLMLVFSIVYDQVFCWDPLKSLKCLRVWRASGWNEKYRHPRG